MAVILGLSLTACERTPLAAKGQNGEGQDAPAAKRVKAARVSIRSTERTLKAIGTLAAREQAMLSVKVPGRLQLILVDLGSTVRAEQKIAQIEPQDYELAVQQAEALLAQARARLGLPLQGSDDRMDPEQASLVKQALALLNEARKNRQRLQQLSEQGIISQSELETAEASFEVAANKYQDALEEVRQRQAILAQRRAELAIARQQLADTALVAPFDGIVMEKRAGIGEFLTRGASVVSLVQIDPLRLRLEIAERDAPGIRARQKVRLKVEGDPASHEGVIQRISPAIDLLNRILLVEADIPNNGSLRPGAFVRAEVISDQEAQVRAVPPNAIIMFAGLEKIFLVQDSKAVERAIVTGQRTDSWVEVINGVNEGDWVILEPGNIKSGQRVEVAP